MDMKIIDLFDENSQALKWKVFIKKMSKMTGCMASAIAVLPMLEVA